MLTFRALSRAPAARAWSLLARPARWSEWAPHVRAGKSLGEPEVEPGRRGVVRVLGAVPVPVEIVDKRPGRSWTWQVGPVRMQHMVDAVPEGCVVSVELIAPGPLEQVIRVTYGPVIAVLLRRLARIAAARGRAP